MIRGGVILNTKQYMIIDNQKRKIITSDIASCRYNPQNQQYDIVFKSGKSYSYSYNRITRLSNPKVLDPTLYHIVHLGRDFFEIDAIYVFEDRYYNYWHICFKNGSERDYFEHELMITKSCLSDDNSKNVFDYLKKTATLSNLKDENGEKLLPKHYEKISSFIGENTALAKYLNPHCCKDIKKCDTVPIFPFGCNASQYKAVKEALENQLSVIQGPPGTGKTQTILNIIANLLITNKTIQVVSNNESAITNILEKLSSPKYGMDFLVALLGKSNNKKDFIKNQIVRYPDLSDWNLEIPDEKSFIEDLNSRSKNLNDIFYKQECLALKKRELQSLKTEQKHFEQYMAETCEHVSKYKIRKKLKSITLMRLWQKCQYISNSKKRLTFFFKIKSCIVYGISDWDFYKIEISQIINMFQSLYYQSRISELADEIAAFEHDLKAQDAVKLTDEFEKLSMDYLKRKLYDKYGQSRFRPIFCEEDFWNNPSKIQEEYPIILSTTFSSRKSLSLRTEYDYLIMDEASQVDISTGALALSCAKNAVIVGDSKQLPNIVDANTKIKADAIFGTFNIDEGYRYSKYSFLQSICMVIPDIPQTLLREHYRCHPKIIDFCNYKFYNGELIIMTTDNGEENVMSVIKTVVGNHARNRMNQRQIDSVVQEILPQLQYSQAEIGVIAPYNNQVDALQEVLSKTEIDIATVHKFQGREKDAIILTTVDNEITDFTDDPYLLNVAVSRAKKQLCLVISGNEQPKDSNIFDLVSYIEYNNFSITESKLYSVFDYLYDQYTQSRMEFLKKHKRISEYDSENLMYALIQDTLVEYGLSFLKVVCQMPLNMLIRDPNLLNEEECRYAMHNATHLDFLIFNRISKKPVLAIEVDGFYYHKNGTAQAERDKMKNHILDLYEIPYLRFATNGSNEKAKLVEKLTELLKVE